MPMLAFKKTEICIINVVGPENVGIALQCCCYCCDLRRIAERCRLISESSGPDNEPTL